MTFLIVIVGVLMVVALWQAVKVQAMRVALKRTEGASRSARNQHDELKNLRLKLEFAIKSLGATIWEYDVTNDRLWSKSPDSLLGCGISFDEYVAIHDPQQELMIRREFDKLRSGAIESLTMKLRLSVGQGDFRWIEIHGRVYQKTTDGQTAKIVGVRQDVHNEVLAHEELSRNRKQLEEYAIKTDLALRSGEIFVWEYDMLTEIFTTPNIDSYMHAGVSRDVFLSSIAPEDLEMVAEVIQEFHIDRTWFSCKIRLNIPNTGWRWVDLSATVLSRDQNGRPIKLTGIKHDVTNEYEMTQELIELRDIAEQANQLKSTFLANMSHEIRTPVNAIVGFSDMIATAENNEQQQEYLKIIDINKDLLLQLINDILDLSKIEAGKLEFYMTEINVNELMGQLEQMFAMRARSGVSVIFESPLDDDPYITCDQNRLAQVMTNFLTNAAKFTFEGDIRIGYKPCEQGTYFYVKDTGKGISTDNLPYVFDRFAKFDPEIHGTGLGLSICKTIVDKFDGQIGVESELGKGSEFWFTVASKLHPCDCENIYAFTDAFTDAFTNDHANANSN